MMGLPWGRPIGEVGKLNCVVVSYSRAYPRGMPEVSYHEIGINIRHSLSAPDHFKMRAILSNLLTLPCSALPAIVTLSVLGFVCLRFEEKRLEQLKALAT